MDSNLSILQAASALARHAAGRQKLTAENIANADTPGFKPRDLEPFQAALSRAGDQPGVAPAAARMVDAPVSETSPNGNAVSLEAEMVRGAEIRMQHDLAVTVYRKAMDMLRLGIGSVR